MASSTTMASKEVRRRFLRRLEAWTRVSGGTLDKTMHSKGEPPKVVITSEQRRGHHVTLVSELQAYVLDPYQTARELQAICGATANVEEEALKSGAQRRVVCVQGLWDRTIAEWLGTRHGLPERCVDNRAALKGGSHSQKKDKKATNVRRN
uniref:SUI1 domain-containing protein n=1 Tax=Haptolina brevifila TaxID=156173 RepID=A0A7S2NM07_9EUKA|mmetsp:Transcript_82016/g.163318  ORF Transcript_82016/g.163318 Transcript_82016/m.163318 type:complete len:151 (+) Transcript_82016:223-675(+)